MEPESCINCGNTQHTSPITMRCEEPCSIERPQMVDPATAAIIEAKKTERRNHFTRVLQGNGTWSGSKFGVPR